MKLPLNQKIFVNRTLNLNSIKLIGFDMDYTLVLYNEEEVESTAFEGAVQLLVERYAWDERILSLKYEGNRIIRGLGIDKRLGNIIKINRFGYVKDALHGDHYYDRNEIRKHYGSEIVSFGHPRYEMVHTLFALASSELYSKLIELRDGSGIAQNKTYEDIYEEVIDCINRVHRQGYLKKRIAAQPERYLNQDPNYYDTLYMLKKFGKKLALITNSEWEYTDTVMKYSVEAFQEQGQSWRDLFDIVVVDADKPGFFNQRNRFFQVIPESGYLMNVLDQIQEKNIYQGGNSAEIELLFGLESSRILYVGDHIYSDVYQSKKMSKWRTLLVISELEKELISVGDGEENLEKIRQHMNRKEDLEFALDQIRKKQIIPNKKNSYHSVKESESEIKNELEQLDQILGEEITAYNRNFNEHWGELMWAGNDQSFFGMNIERYACAYTSKVSNLLQYSPTHYFRPPIKSHF